MRERSIVFLAAMASAALVALGASSAFAGPIGDLPPPTIDVNGAALDVAALACSPGERGWTCGGEGLEGDGFRLDSWSFLLDPDPSISSSIVLTNLNSSTQTFILTVTLPIAPMGPALSITGSVGAGSLTDLNANGATLTDAGSSIYAALIDGATVRTLLDPPQSFTAPANPLGAPSTVPIPMESFGPEPLGQPANATIAMKLRFTLTGGDQVALPMTFDAQPVPEPGTLALLGGGLALLAGRRRSV